MGLYDAWTLGMVDMSPRAVEGRRIHAICTEAREAAWAAAMAGFAGRPDQAQARLDADQIGQAAYWAKRRKLSATP
jgi:hypothetical protein